jgi:uncharacterized hydrophobic protein (TIGR00271 family)
MAARFRVEAADIERMANATLLSYGSDASEKTSKFWILLILAGIIATAGIATDSTATLIGAMIVAPLMTPIIGTAFALVLAKHDYLLHSALKVTGGALVVIGTAFLFGVLEPISLSVEGNSQVAARVHPRLIDLLAALATGMVGSFALVRKDISDTLPGVAVAIALVPPLAVAGLTLHDGKFEEALGALLLFMTNVTAIIFTATLTLILYKVRETARSAGYPIGDLKGRSLSMVVAIMILVAIPLTFGTQKVFRQSLIKFTAAPLAQQWAEANGWKIVRLDARISRLRSSELNVVAFGPPPQIAPEALRSALDEIGYSDVDLTVELIVGGSETLPGSGQPAPAKPQLMN